MLHCASLEDVRQGKVTDAYFTRPRQILCERLDSVQIDTPSRRRGAIDRRCW